MVRFSCFNGDTSSAKSKKALRASSEAMQKKAHDSSHILVAKTPLRTRSLGSVSKDAQVDAQVCEIDKHFSSSASVERFCKFEDLASKLDFLSEKSMPQTTVLKKSLSLGSALCPSVQSLSDGNEKDQGYSSDSLDQRVLVGSECSGNQAISPNSQHQRAPQSNLAANNESIFSIADSPNSEKGSPEYSETTFSGEGAKESGYYPPCTTNRMATSCSLPDIGPSGRDLDKCLSESKSAEDFHTLEPGWKNVANHEVQLQIIEDEVENDSLCKAEIKNHTNSFNDNYDGSSYSTSAKDWVIPIMDEMNIAREESSNPQLVDDVTSQSFKSKRIADWVNDLRHCSTLEETTELLGADDDPPKKSADVPDGGSFFAKVDEKASPGMEAAKRYISSLSASATTAQLSNHGLAVIPFLSAFVGLKVLNLSGNSIVKITLGALPRGLHALNLSKNKISTIEGLRELTRLRVLDLSYNRILRIGHGLASCSSLKELYLAGNRIGEVEGLHRLLKLTVLDLRFNKISTAKCLGQLAANYNSLQAISLEGNPAQKNVGDDQLKKYLLGLLPHLVYFNRHATKASTPKDATDRAVRLGMNSHQFDRGLRPDSKSSRKASRVASGTRLSSKSVHGRKSQAATSPKRSRGRPVLPPSGNRAATSNHQILHVDLNSKVLHLRSELSMRRSRSEGTLAAL